MSEKPTMLSYTTSQQDILLQALAQYPQNIDLLMTAALPYERMLILATGSSINAATSSKYYLSSKAGVVIDIEEPYNYQHFVKQPATNSLVLGISQSGQSTATIDALQSLDPSNHKLAVTSIPDSEITGAVSGVLDILSGRERVGYVTLGFSATVLALMLFGLRLGVKKGLVTAEEEQAELAEFKAIIESFGTALAATEEFFVANQRDLGGAKRFMAIAYGSAFGTAKEIETKFSETIRVPSSGIDLEAFMHGPYLEMQPNYRLFFLDTPGPANVLEKAQLLRTYEEKVTPYVYLVSVTGKQAENDKQLILPPVTDPEKAPLLLMVPFQLLSWLISHEKGIDITQRIYTDFAASVKSKTTVQDYV